MGAGINRFVSPQALSALGRLPLLARDVVEGFITGLHTSPFHGFSVEFAEHRKYSPGDPLRDLDWTAYARTDRYYIKRYREETNLRCCLLLDASASMGFASAEISKFDYACRLAACIGYLAMRQRDAIGLTIAGGDEEKRLPPSSRMAHLGLVMDMLEAAKPGGVPAIPAAFHNAAEYMRRRGLVVAFSDLLDGEEELVKALRHLRHRRHEVILFHILDPAEEDLPYRHVSEFIDLENGEKIKVDPQAVRAQYQKEIASFRARYRKLCSDCAIDYVAVNTSEKFETLLMRYLVRRSRA